MKNEIKIQMLNKLVEAYTRYDAAIIENHLAEDVHYASMQVFDELKTKKELMDYLRAKLQTMKNKLETLNLQMYKGQCGLALLVANAKTPESGDYLLQSL